MSIVTQLKPYQQEAIAWMQAREQSFETPGGCILDEPGLGKTLQMLGLILSTQYHPTLVVTPATILGVWCDEIRKHTTVLPEDVFVYHGRDRFVVPTNVYKYKIVLTTYSIIGQEFENVKSANPFYNDSIFNMPFARVILDESHHIKNDKTRWSQGVHHLCARSRWINTATPFQNGVQEVHNLLSFLRVPIDHLDTLDKTKDALLSVSLRRKKTQTLANLPVKHKHVHWLEFTPAERHVYRRIHNAQTIATIMRWRQCCVSASLVDPTFPEVSSKIQRTLDIIELCKKRNEKVVVTSQWISVLQSIHARHTDHALIVCGSLTVQERMARVSQFQKNPDITVLCLSMTAGSEGITLSAANHVILMDPWWNDTRTLQVADRVHRLTQTRPVHVHYLYIKKTIEEAMLRLNQKKRTMAEFIVGDTIQSQ